jgi:hypothetical protein
MDSQTTNLIKHGHPVSARVRLMDPLAVDINPDVEIWAIVDKVGSPVDPADTDNWGGVRSYVSIRWTMRTRTGLTLQLVALYHDRCAKS